MEDYKLRFIKEYTELSERVEKLSNMLSNWEVGKLDFEPKCPKALLENQLTTMKIYLSILQQRAKIEEIEV